VTGRSSYHGNPANWAKFTAGVQKKAEKDTKTILHHTEELKKDLTRSLSRFKKAAEEVRCLAEVLEAKKDLKTQPPRSALPGGHHLFHNMLGIRKGERGWEKASRSRGLGTIGNMRKHIP